MGTQDHYLNKKIGIIGIGNMGESLVKGFLKADSFVKENVVVYDCFPEKMAGLVKDYGVQGASSSEELVAQCDVVFLAVKPQDLGELLDDISKKATDDKIFVSIIAGASIHFMRVKLGKNTKVIRLMPNTPCTIGAGVIGMAHNHRIEQEDIELVLELLQHTGTVVKVKEEHMDAVTGLSGSGPAYVFLMIQSLASGGVKQGLSREQSLILAARTVEGAAKMVLETGQHPDVLKDMVSSPAGTAIHGLQFLEDAGVRGAFMQAVEVGSDRAFAIRKQAEEKRQRLKEQD